MGSRLLKIALFLFAFWVNLTELRADRDTVWLLIFEARAPRLKPFSIGGHAFVSWAFKTDSACVRAERALGFYPKQGSNVFSALFTRRPGRVVPGRFENGKGNRTHLLAVEVGRWKWAETLDAACDWDGSPYNLFSRNCVAFANSVAQKAGLRKARTRHRIGFPCGPVRFLRRLSEINSSKESHVRCLDIPQDQER